MYCVNCSHCNQGCNASNSVTNEELNIYVKETINTMLEDGILVRPDDVYMTSQELNGTILRTTLNNSIVFETDLSVILRANMDYLKDYVDNILIDLIGNIPDA